MIELGIVAGGTALTGLILCLAIYKSSGQSSFLYSNARIVSRATYILDKNKLEELSGLKSLPELINQLKNTEYQHHMETINKESITEFNMALEKGYIDSINEIKKISPKKFRKVYEVYAKIFESKIIKTFFRSRFAKIKINEHLLAPIGMINPSLLKHLHDTKTVADIKLVLRDTDYENIFEKEFTSVEEFDFAIEKDIMNDVDEIFDSIKVYDKKIILDIFKKRREIKNILTLLKFRIRGMDKEEQAEIIKIENIDVTKAIDAPDIKAFVGVFKSTEYEGPLNNALKDFEKNDDYYSFEKELLRYYLNFIKNNDLSYSIGPYPIISYITKKEIEQKNLLIIAKGILSKVEKEKIKEMII